MADYGHKLTDKQLKKLERDIAREYRKATKEASAKLQAYLAEDEAKRKVQMSLLKAGKISQKDYNDWVFRHTMMGKRWKEMLNVLAKDYHNANKIALKIAKNRMPDIYALNANFGTYQLEHDGRIDTSFTLYNHDTAEYLLEQERQLMPGPSTRKQKQIAANKDMQWNKKQIQSAVLQGILQGESPYEVARRLQHVGQMNYNSAVRYARTMTTNAQNAGRYQAFRRADNLGVDLTIEWQATLDGRTRHEHRLMHGQRRNVGEPFNVNGVEILWPAQPNYKGENIPQELIWNCRCTLLSWVKGFEGTTVTHSPKMGDMSFEEWQHAKEPKPFTQKQKPSTIDDPNVVSWVKPIVGKHSRKQDAQATNPNFTSGAWEWRNNCQRCVTTYEARRRGYDVTALPNYSKRDKLALDFSLPFNKGDRKFNPLWYEAGLTMTTSRGFSKQDCLNTVDKLMTGYGKGSRAVISGFWTSSGEGHVFIAENIGGKVHFIDPQSGNMNCKDNFDKMGPRGIWILRIDDLPFNSTIKDVFRNDVS